MNDEFDFSDETQLYLEWTQDFFTSLMTEIWKLGGEDAELQKQWKTLEPVIIDAFNKAKRYDICE